MREYNSITRYPLGLSQQWAGKPCWIATAAMLAASVASSIIGGAKSRKAAQKAQRENAYRKNAEKAWYEKEYNTDYLDTKAGQNLMRKAQDVQDRYVKKAQGAAAVTGGTDASVATAKEQANRVMGDTFADIASQDTSRKQKVADKHIDNVRELSNESQQIELSKAQATNEAAQGMSNALMSAAVTRMGSQPTKGNSQTVNVIASPSNGGDNTNVYATTPQGNVSGIPSLEDAVGETKKKVRYL